MIKTIILVFCLIAFNSINGQTRYRDPVPLSGLDRVMEVQSGLQDRYRENSRRVSDKIDDIASLVDRVKRRNEGLTENQSEYIQQLVLTITSSSFKNLDYTNDSRIRSVMDYLRAIENEIYTW